MILLGKRPIGVVIFGLILIVTSIDSLRYVPPYEIYKQINHEWPENIIKIRFLVSYLLRIIGLISGVGILCLSDLFRKILIGLSIFSVLTLPLRHTYSAQFIYSEPIYHQHGSMFSLQTFTWLAVIFRWMIDGLFSLSLIYYLTRPKVISIFISKTEEKPLK